MGTIWVKEFTGGLDTRRLAETTAGGVLIRASDGHINRGGEFEQRAAFVLAYVLPEGTTGLAASSSGLAVFGANSTSAPLPSGVTYGPLVPPFAANVRKVLSTTRFKGLLYVAAEYTNGSVLNFYNGAQVTDWPVSDSIYGRFVLTSKSRVYAVAGPNLLFSAVGQPANFNSGTGKGFIDMSTQATGSENLLAITEYQNFLAIFAERTIQLEFVDPDPAAFRQVQVLNNTGTIAPLSVIQFGDNDVFYLDKSGIRSLRARQSINVAFSSDTGNPIDDLVTAKLDSLTLAERRNAIAVIEPRDGRLWVAVKDVIYVFSYFTGSKVSAWTTYNPGFNIDDMVVFDGRVYLRSGDQIYVYGGLGDTPVYSNDVQAEAWLPYLDANVPTRRKKFDGVDAAVRGTWEVYASFDPEGGASDRVATISRTTFDSDRIPAGGDATHVSMRFKSRQGPAGGGPAILGSVVIHHDLDDNED